MPSMPQSVSFPALGTTAVVVVTQPAAAEAARTVVDQEVGDFDAACSRFRDDSELARVNAGAGAPVEVSPLLLDAVEVALRAARLTGGVVSPTVGSAMRIIGYDRDFAQVPPDGPPPVVRITPVPGWRMVQVDRLAGTLRVPAGVELDLGATAKALCADRCAQNAARSTGSGVLVSLGGDIAVAGEVPEGGWVIRVTDDHAAREGTLPGTPGQTVAIISGGLATSSTTVRRWVRGGTTMHHLVDPATGQPAAGGWRTATVVAATCVDANIASTTAIVLGARAPAWLAERGLSARLVADDGSVCLVGGWPDDDPTSGSGRDDDPTSESGEPGAASEQPPAERAAC